MVYFLQWKLVFNYWSSVEPSVIPISEIEKKKVLCEEMIRVEAILSEINYN